jgi:anti-anti-sigma factor
MIPHEEAAMPLKVRVEEGRSFTKTITLEGRLDSESVAALDDPLEAVLASALKVLVFDLSGLEYISSAGLRSLFRAQKSMTARSGKVLLLNPQPPVQKVFDIVKATDVNAVFRSVAELDAYLDAMQKQVAGGE